MTNERAHKLAEAALNYIAENGEQRFWRPTAKANGIHTRTFDSRIEHGMAPEDAATHAGSLKKPDPHSIRQRCFALGYKSTSRYQFVREELDNLGVEYTVDDVFDIMAARKRGRTLT